MSLLTPVLSIGATLASFQSLGKIPVSNEVSNIVTKDLEITRHAIIKIKLEMLSGPRDFFRFHARDCTYNTVSENRLNLNTTEFNWCTSFLVT